MSMKKLFKEYDALSGLPLKLLAYETRKAIKNRMAELRDAILDEAGEIEERILELASNCNELHDELENERERDQESNDGTIVEELKDENKKVKAELSKALEELGSRDYRDTQKQSPGTGQVFAFNNTSKDQGFFRGSAIITGEINTKDGLDHVTIRNGLPCLFNESPNFSRDCRPAKLDIMWQAREV